MSSTFKFIDEVQEQAFRVTLQASGLSEDGFIQHRKGVMGTLKPLVDFRRSQSAKAAWRANRPKYLAGIKTWHKSTKGKRFHRALGRFLATRVMSHGAATEAWHIASDNLYEFVEAVSSMVTHMMIECRYYHDANDQVYLEGAVECAGVMCGELIAEVLRSSCVGCEWQDFLCELVLPSSIANGVTAITGLDETTYVKAIQGVLINTEVLSGSVLDELGSGGLVGLLHACLADPSGACDSGEASSANDVVSEG